MNLFIRLVSGIVCKHGWKTELALEYDRIEVTIDDVLPIVSW